MRNLKIFDDRIHVEIGELLSVEGPVKMEPINIRNGKRKLKYYSDKSAEMIKQLCDTNIRHNLDANVINHSIFDPITGCFDTNEKLMSVISIGEYLTTLNGFDAIVELYKDDEIFVKKCHDIREKILKGKAISSQDSKSYYVLVGGNTRFSEMFIENLNKEFSNKSDTIPFGIKSLENFKKRLPVKLTVSENSSSNQITAWMKENQFAYDLFMLQDNLLCGKKNWPEKIYRSSLCSTIMSLVTYGYDGSCNITEYFRSQEGLLKEVGLNYDRAITLYLLEQFNTIDKDLRSAQKSSSPLVKTRYFDDGNDKFSRKLNEILRRIIPMGAIKSKMAQEKKSFLEFIGFDFKTLSIVDVKKMSKFLNSISEPIVRVIEARKSAKAQFVKDAIIKCYVNHQNYFYDFVGDDLSTQLGLFISSNTGSAVQTALEKVLMKRCEATEKLLNIAYETIDVLKEENARLEKVNKKLKGGK